jgi:hypothetical protein
MTRKLLLTCGILSSLLYTGMNIIAPMYFEGYSSAGQTVSELSAIGAPTRPAWLAWALVYTLLFIAFGWGVRMSAGQNRALRITGGLILLYGIVSLAWPFAPMHLRGAEFSLTDAMHIALGMVTIVLMILIMGYGAGAFDKPFRYYSIVSLVVYIVFGALTGIDSPRIAENLPTPWIGIWERIIIGDFLLWVIVLAVILLQRAATFGKLGAENS